MEQNNAIEEIILLDEDGQEAKFEHILTFLHEGARYVALSPAADEDSAMEDDEEEVVLFRIEQVDGEDTYRSIDNEVLLDEVFDAFLEMMEEIEGGEEEK